MKEKDFFEGTRLEGLEVLARIKKLFYGCSARPRTDTVKGNYVCSSPARLRPKIGLSPGQKKSVWIFKKDSKPIAAKDLQVLRYGL
jgi:hypothetical protein